MGVTIFLNYFQLKKISQKCNVTTIENFSRRIKIVSKKTNTKKLEYYFLETMINSDLYLVSSKLFYEIKAAFNKLSTTNSKINIIHKRAKKSQEGLKPFELVVLQLYCSAEALGKAFVTKSKYVNYRILSKLTDIATEVAKTAPPKENFAFQFLQTLITKISDKVFATPSTKNKQSQKSKKYTSFIKLIDSLKQQQTNTKKQKKQDPTQQLNKLLEKKEELLTPKEKFLHQQFFQLLKKLVLAKASILKLLLPKNFINKNLLDSLKNLIDKENTINEHLNQIKLQEKKIDLPYFLPYIIILDLKIEKKLNSDLKSFADKNSKNAEKIISMLNEFATIFMSDPKLASSFFVLNHVKIFLQEKVSLIKNNFYSNFLDETGAIKKEFAHIYKNILTNQGKLDKNKTKILIEELLNIGKKTREYKSKVIFIVKILFGSKNNLQAFQTTESNKKIWKRLLECFEENTNVQITANPSTKYKGGDSDSGTDSWSSGHQ